MKTTVKQQRIAMTIFVLATVLFAASAYIKYEPSSILALGTMLVTFPFAFTSVRR